MTVIGHNFPKTRRARKEELARIKMNNPISTKKVPGKGTRPVYRIPLEYLSYNPYNTRFLAQAKTLERRFGQELSDEISEHIIEIEKFIWKEKKDRNESTIDSLIKHGQLEAGVVTADGIILAGNRRFRLLNEIVRNPDTYKSKRTGTDGLEYFEAVILDDEALSKKEIVKYESFYQFGVEDKVEYNPIQKYIAAKDQKDLGFSDQEIADNFITLSKGKSNEVVKWLTVFEIMSDYLDYIKESGIYTALEGREEAFLNLNSLLKSYRARGSRAGSVPWPYDENDLIALKVVFFDYIRLNIPTHDFRIFKDIFSDQTQWRTFESNVNEIVADERNQLKSFDDYRKENPDVDETTISIIRQNDYKENVEKGLNRLYGVENARIKSIEAQEKPMEILNAIKQKLSKLEEDMNNNPDKEIFETEEFYGAVNEIRKRIGRIKQQVD